MKRFDYYQPESLKEAYQLMEKFKGEALYVAGGTDVIVRIKQRAIEPEALISLRGLKELRGIKDNGGLTLGAGTLFRDIERYPLIAKEYPALHQAASMLANLQIRNVATVGGNLCNAAPSADSAPPLIVLGAMVVLEGPGGKRKMSLEDFFTGPGQTAKEPQEIMREIHIPEKDANTATVFLKIGRVSQDIAIANAAALVTMENKVCKRCRLAVGAVAPVPLRLKGIEEKIEGEEITDDLLQEVEKMVCDAVSPITDVRATKEYRRTVSGVLVKRAIAQAVASLEG
ncbi:MAG: xanthine dehydrogenase family protein subunit M [Deltaproteobacteria bacterium]|nr:xanthine dehydrogenase family protein subunit M [Deltaproteobacteria bacterium]MBW1928158.1 xanthine dehydrogenase family protein subunit M [Deltaproteobacteria bacterium]MBW2025402.1 xanthine dehydrogenase family protein subunit M [Deltaproteobacteria bacterium]MBW2125345.1 xanthine dehydrogenase family protein subunit M [Deltaproteobacteria bacterium]RLB17229.1 MAG: xanthine dehydrogenase family protein subunit M [Deltaproteobacteria bacterium]